MTILKILGCCVLLLLVLFCMLLFFFYLREYYAKWRGERALAERLGKCEEMQKEKTRILNEIEKTVSEYSEESINSEWQGYYAQLGKFETEENAALLALVWLFHNYEIRKRELCPELCEKLDSIQECLLVENGLIARLEKVCRPPYFMNCANYGYWQEYCKECNSSAT